MISSTVLYLLAAVILFSCWMMMRGLRSKAPFQSKPKPRNGRGCC